MTKKTRKPSHLPEPESKEPRGDQAQEPGAPGDSPHPDETPGIPGEMTFESRSAPGLDVEIAMLRSRLRKFIKAKKVHNRDAQLTKTLDLLIRALAAKARIYPGSYTPGEDGIEEMLKDASEKFGLKIIPWDTNC